MTDTVQRVASDAYQGDVRGLIAGVVILAIAIFFIWFKEFVKRK